MYHVLKYPLFAVILVAVIMAVISGVVLGIWQILTITTIVYSQWGVLGVIVALLAFPFTLVVVPAYSGIAHGDWRLLLFYPASAAVWGIVIGGTMALFATYPIHHKGEKQNATLT